MYWTPNFLGWQLGVMQNQRQHFFPNRNEREEVRVKEKACFIFSQNPLAPLLKIQNLALHYNANHQYIPKLFSHTCKPIFFSFLDTFHVCFKFCTASQVLICDVNPVVCVMFAKCTFSKQIISVHSPRMKNQDSIFHQIPFQSFNIGPFFQYFTSTYKTMQNVLHITKQLSSYFTNFIHFLCLYKQTYSRNYVK